MTQFSLNSTVNARKKKNYYIKAENQFQQRRKEETKKLNIINICTIQITLKQKKKILGRCFQFDCNLSQFEFQMKFSVIFFTSLYSSRAPYFAIVRLDLTLSEIWRQVKRV